MKWFNNLKIYKKFLTVGAIVLPFLLALAGTGLWGANEINNILQQSQSQQIPSIYTLSQAVEKGESARIYVRQALLETDADRLQNAITTARDDLSLVRKSWDEYTKLDAIDQEKALWPQFETEYKAWIDENDLILKQAALNTPDSRQKATVQLMQASSHGDKVSEILASLSTINYKGTDQLALTARNSFGAVIILIIASGLLVVALTAAAGTVLARSISAPINKLKTATQAVASGDLTQRVAISTKDEMGQLGEAFNLMIENLSELNQEITRAGRELSGSAAELLSLVNQQTAGASEQSAAIHQTTSTVNEVKATTEQTSQRARSMSDTATRFVSVAEEGQQVVSETIVGMNTIKDQVESIAENILALSEQTQQIGEIIATVNDIAEQSNLLALNAAVEAARAGEHGRGFAVVANEVRSLAERSKQATTQVRTILNDIQKATNAVVMVTEEGTKGVDHGVKLVDRAGLTIRQLSDVIRENLASTQQIIAVVQQQNVGVEQVAQSMGNINEVTNQNVTATHQLQQSVEGMTRLVERFGELTGRYKLIEQGGTSRNHTNAHSSWATTN
ncbi:MAG: methyl-accepting chemotaxis protein [Chloroflexi bacterium]|nr:methyl-accepting chemotaxis protein [Chloroflexota bacterium]